MSNYSTARWSAFQYKLDGLMAMPEFKAKPSNTLAKFMRNTDFLIPASEKERILGVKQTDQDTVETNLIYKQSVGTGSARAYDHAGSINDSKKTTVTFTTYTSDFTYSLKSGDRTVFSLAEIVAKQLRSAIIDLHGAIETALITSLNTNKSQAVVSVTPRSGEWDATNFIFQIASDDFNRWAQRIKGFMREQYYKTQFDAIVDEVLFQEYEYLMQQGQGNSTNLGWQFGGLVSDVSEEITEDESYKGLGYVFPTGTLGIIPWIPKLNRQGFGDAGAVGGFYTTMPDPLGSGLVFAVHEYYTAADNQNAAGETQDVNVNVELSVDLAPIYAPMQTSSASPVFKFGVLAGGGA